MRSIRRLMLGLIGLALLPQTGAAQEGRYFKDAWFWGAKAGNLTYWTTRVRHGQAPQIGAEWLITRTRGGMVVALDQAFFTARTSVFDASAPGGEREVEIKNLRRFTMQGIIFPKEYGPLRPYAALGFAVNLIQSAEPVGTVDCACVYQTIADQKDRGSPILTLGAQFQLMRFSVFGQGSYMPSHEGFLLNNNESYFLEAGLRYNIGTSVDRPGR